MDITKPRRVKKHWKMTKLIEAGLTNPFMAAILTPSCNSKAGFRSPSKGHKRPLSNVVFLYPSKTQFFFVMVGCIEQPLKRLAGSFAGTANLIYPTTRECKKICVNCL